VSAAPVTVVILFAEQREKEREERDSEEKDNEERC
jgi:hypothetical protein